MLVYCIGWHTALICRETHALRIIVLGCLDLMAGMLGCFPLVVAGPFSKGGCYKFQFFQKPLDLRVYPQIVPILI